MYNSLFRVFVDSLPSDYFNHFKNLQIDDPTAIYSPAYLSFLKDYFTLNIPKEYEKQSGFYRVRNFKSYRLQKSKIELKGEVKNVIT
ncbi:MAG: hypothetical protein AAF600_22040 [Bacteroidota bacterium]